MSDPATCMHVYMYIYIHIHIYIYIYIQSLRQGQQEGRHVRPRDLPFAGDEPGRRRLAEEDFGHALERPLRTRHVQRCLVLVRRCIQRRPEVKQRLDQHTVSPGRSQVHRRFTAATPLLNPGPCLDEHARGVHPPVLGHHVQQRTTRRHARVGAGVGGQQQVSDVCLLLGVEVRKESLDLVKLVGERVRHEDAFVLRRQHPAPSLDTVAIRTTAPHVRTIITTALHLSRRPALQLRPNRPPSLPLLLARRCLRRLARTRM